LSRIYLDDAGSAPALPEVLEALRAVPPGNPSSPHAEGRAARTALDRARDLAAAAVGAERTEVVFTSSGTESVNLALFGTSGPLLSWAAEHQSVLGAARRMQALGRAVTVAAVDAGARVDVDAINAGTAVVSVGLANNEVGTVQPVREVIARAHDIGALVHVDACAGPRWIDVPEGADLVSFSGHKLGAGRGGMLYVRDGVRLEPLLYGGQQEWGKRAGFEDVASATAMAVALSVCARERHARSSVAYSQSLALMLVLRDLGGRMTGAEDRLPNVASCAFAGRRGEDMLLALDLAGVAASSGSACASGSLDPSHVLLATGMTLEEALGSLRLSTGYATTEAEVVRAGEILYSVLSRRGVHA
jgi:cysteine desulfurase